jgi:methyl-accepting chemotaxis protein
MFKNMSIKVKLILMGLITVSAMFVMLGLFEYSNSENGAFNGGLALLEQIKTDVLTLRRNEKDFLARNDIKYQNTFADNHATLMGKLDTLEQFIDRLDLDKMKIEGLQDLVSSYKSIFDKIVELNVKIGLDEKSGLRGTLRDSVRTVEGLLFEKDETLLIADMLMLRRREKDFLLRMDINYFNKFEIDFAKMNEHLNSSAILSASDKAEITRLLMIYRKEFKNLVGGYTERGLTPKDGLLGALRSTIQKSESLLTEYLEEMQSVIADKMSFQKSLILVDRLLLVGQKQDFRSGQTGLQTHPSPTVHMNNYYQTDKKGHLKNSGQCVTAWKYFRFYFFFTLFR